MNVIVKRDRQIPLNVVRDSAVSYLDHIFENEFNHFFNNFFGNSWNTTNTKKSSYPKIDIYDNSFDIKIEAAIPGLSKEDIDISINEQILTIKGISKQAKEENINNYKVKELHKSSFSRSINLSEDIYDLDKIKAKVENGILTINVPKKSMQVKQNVKKIEVQ